MSTLRKTLRWVAWTVVAIAAVPVVLYLFAYVVNFGDRPPSAEALELAAAPAPAPVEDTANGYVYLLGFGAMRDADPADLGAKRAAWIRKLATDYDVDLTSDPLPDTLVTLPPNPAPIDAILKVCETPTAECVAALEGATDLRAALAEVDWRIARYRTLLAYRAWREVTTNDIRGPLGPYVLVRDPRRLYLLDTWLLAAAGDATQVNARLEADLAFWRLALAEADSLLGKAVAARYVGDHFAWGNAILRRLPPERRADGVPAAWRRALSDAERSLRRPLVNEWRFRDASFRSIKSTGLLFPLPKGTPDSRSAYDRFEMQLARPLLQVQDLANRDAAALLKLDGLLRVAYPELNAALARAPEVDAWESGILAVTYNIVGRALVGEGRAPLLANYGARIADLEGVRRAALMIADLRGLGIPPQLAGPMIPLAAVRNPYTGGAFEWHADSNTVTFTGLEHGDATHAFPY